MRRVIIFVLVAAILVAAAWFIAGIPGHVTASFGSISVETSAPVAIFALIVLAGLIFLLWYILGLVISLPRRGSAWRIRRTQRLGDQSVTRLLVALAADEKREAWKEARRTRRLLGDSPYTLLLTAEAGRLSGHEDEAEKAFRALATRRDSRFLGLRGLLRQAMARQDWAEAMKLAKEAEDARPGTTWLRQERTELALKTENWGEALELADQDDRRVSYLVAAADVEADNARALGYAKRAWRLDQAFIPAALAYANRLRKAGQERRAQAVIVKTWKRAPHPDLAAFALAQLKDKTARLQAAKRLVASRPTDPESYVLLTRTALEAGDTREARHNAELLQRSGFKQRRLYLLVAEIEEMERGDTEEGRGAQREALRQAAIADPDSRWQCTTCRTDYGSWRPKCSVCQSVGTVSWIASAPHEQLPVIEPRVPIQAA